MLKQKITILEKELDIVKSHFVQPRKQQQSEELVDARYQIYFQDHRISNKVKAVLQECVAEALDKKYFRPEQPCKVELIQDDPTQVRWQAIRLTTKGCSGSMFRSIAKHRVSEEGDLGVLCTK